MTKGARFRAARVGSIAAGVAGLCISLTVAGSAVAATNQSAGVSTAVMHRTAARTMPTGAALFIFDSSFGDTQRPLYFQVVGRGFRPGERVTIRASLASPGQASGSEAALLPVQVAANDYGQVAATLDGGGYTGSGDGFVIRASGDQHVASIVDLVLPGASYTAPGSN